MLSNQCVDNSFPGSVAAADARRGKPYTGAKRETGRQSAGEPSGWRLSHK